MDAQENVFLSGEGDRWFERNIFKMEVGANQDPVIKKFIEGHIAPTFVGEIGCSNGWRLQKIKQLISPEPNDRNVGGYCFGVDPSKAAISNGTARFPGIDLAIGTATAFPWRTGQLDVLIYGFCLYVCDPEDLFEIVTQGNRVLIEGGHLFIHDFDPEYPHSVPNHHVKGLMTFKMNFANLWLAHPQYSMVSKTAYPDGTAVTVLRKRSVTEGFPMQEAPTC